MTKIIIQVVSLEKIESKVDESNAVTFLITMMQARKRAQERKYVIYGHANPALQAKERVKLTEMLQAAETAQDAEAVQLSKFRLDNLGRKVPLDTAVQLLGSTKSKDWVVAPTCSSCGEEVHLTGVHSLKTKATYAHAPLDPATAPAERCELRSNVDTRFVGHTGHHDPELAKKNRAAFYQPEIVAQFVQVAHNILGRDYKTDIPERVLQRADELKIWSQVHDPKLAPFQLMALTGNRFDATFLDGSRHKIGFVLEQHYTAKDQNNGSLHPSDLRLYGVFAHHRYQGAAKLWSIPGLKRHWGFMVSQQDWDAARRETTGQQLDILTPAPPATAHYGKDAAKKTYLIVSHATTDNLAPISYTQVQRALAGNIPVSDYRRSLIARTDALIAQFGAGPLRRAKASQPSTAPAAAR